MKSLRMALIVPITMLCILFGMELIRFPHSYFCGIQCSFKLWLEIKDVDILTRHLIQASHRCKTEIEAKQFEAECLSVVSRANKAVKRLIENPR